MKLHTQKPYWFLPEGIKKIEELKQATYMGLWCTKSPDGYWHESPVDVFYQPNPDISKGHTHYFGLFYRHGTLYITDAASAFSEPLWGLLVGDQVIVSRYRHDFVQEGSSFVDGGRDYFKNSGNATTVKVTVNGSEFGFELQEYA